jgi:uncharacterized membrane protein YozB (DUF420 family)
MNSIGFENIVVLHAGTSPVTSQTVLMFMFVVLAILVVGIGSGYVVKSKDSLKQHRWYLIIAVVFTLVPTLLVMIPTIFRFYTDPDAMLFSSISLTQIAHAAVSIPALATAILYTFGRLPQNIKIGMRWAASLWVASIILGVLMFLQMMELIPTF